MRHLTRNALLVAAGVAVVLLGAACSEDEGGGAFSVARADAARNEDPSVSASELGELTTGNTAFATDLYHVLKDREGNLFLSPYSISVALAMTYAGAAGDTAEEMADALHFDLPPDELHPGFNRLDLELKARAEVEAQDDEGDPFVLSIANSLWAEQSYKFLAPFLETLAVNYDAGLRLVDYINDAEGARKAINAWVSEEAKDRIPELIPQGVINDLTRLVLTNAIYFKASWAEPFEASLTSNGNFHLLDGSTVTAPLMQFGRTRPLRYAEGSDYQAIELPYTGDEVAMMVILPADGRYEAFEDDFDEEKLATIVTALESEEVNVTLPKFEFSSDVPLKQSLTALGMPVAFEPGLADFSGMDGTQNLFIQDVLHKAFVSVDETGTEAAAATAVVVGLTSAPAEPKRFEANRPFMFLIRDRVTGTVLFLGRVLDPTQ